jgi:signal transduction histidine kinase
MERVLRERDRLRPRRLDLYLTVTLGGLVVATGVLLVDADLIVIVDRTLDVTVNALTALATAGLAALSFARYRESGRLSTLFQGAAMVLLAVIVGAQVMVVLLKYDGRLGLTLGIPEQFPLYLLTAGWLIAAVLFVFGGFAALSSVHARPSAAKRLILLPPIGLGVMGLILYPIRGQLPPLIEDVGIQALVVDPKLAVPLPGVTPLLLTLVLLTGSFLVVAALCYRISAVREGRVTDGVLAVGLLIAAFAEIHFAVFPGIYSGLVTTADVFRLAFVMALLVGIDAEARSDLRALRAAYAALDRLRVTETERAALEERGRLAREIHDGLAQHLWFAKLKHDRLTPLVPDDARPLSAEVGQAIDAAIVEARQALVTMRAGAGPAIPLADLIRQAVDDFGERSALRVEFVADPMPASIPARQQAELLRVVQEALTNVRKHADATMVRVRAGADGDALVVTVTDNGRGFEMDSPRSEGLGLLGMEERARLMGGHLGISSEPSDGTSVSVRLPLEERVAPVVPVIS